MSARKPPSCTWDGEKWTNPAGQTCNEDHCALRGRCPEHVRRGAGVYTCPGCIRRVRKDIAAIVQRYALLPFDVEADGLDSEAFNLHAPAASPEQLAARQAYADSDRGWCTWPPPGDPHHPYLVLGRWEMALREDYGMYSDLFITVTSAATFLAGMLAGEFPHTREFEDFAREIATCRAHLEAVDHDSRTPELGRPCPTCAAEFGKGPRLRKRNAVHPGYRPGQTCPERVKATEKADRKRGWCAWPRAYLEAECKICDGKLDAWHCPDNPVHAWTESEYRNRTDADYVANAEWLTGPQMTERTGVKVATVWKWAERGKVARRTRDGRAVYRVADVLQHAEVPAHGGAPATEVS